MKFIDGGICAVRGVKANGIKQGKNGLAIIVTESLHPSTAGVFTQNKVTAAPVIITREALSKRELKGIIANSGSANAFTGSRGIQEAKWMAGILARELSCDHENIGVASTGVIGQNLDKEWIESHFDEVFKGLSASPGSSKASATAIMTTDTFYKEIAVELDNGVRIAGIAKGAGMIEPDMATMLAFLYTDAIISRETLDVCLKRAVDKSFNMVVVDGDTSTNDMAIISATGYQECNEEAFQEGLDRVCTGLARMMAKDGEGATKIMEVRVTGAKSSEDAKKIARAIVRSPLVKTALFGKDPNWGRIVAAAGYSGADIDQDKISLKFRDNKQEAVVVDSGEIIQGQTGLLKDIMESDEIIIEIDIGLGNEKAVSWGCDMTYDYVKINAMYTT